MKMRLKSLTAASLFSDSFRWLRTLNVLVEIERERERVRLSAKSPGDSRQALRSIIRES